tara:strand:- start:158 stop:2044 length:1887 start_codon:yes stop_codon:yes gene_type:complete
MTSRVVIPQLELEQNDNPVRLVVEKGAKQVSTQKVVATSFSNDGCSFSFQPPSQNTVLDRRFDLKIPVLLTSTRAFTSDLQNAGADTNNFAYPSVYGKTQLVAGLAAATDIPAQTKGVANNGDTNKLSNNLAPRQFPLHTIISNIDITINGTHFSTDVNNYVKALMKYTTPEYRNQVFHGSYHHPDTVMGAYDHSLAANSPSLTNPLSVEPNLGRCGETPRGVCMLDITEAANSAVVANGADGTMTTLLFNFVEPLMISPLCLNYGKGMTNINNIEITLRFRTDLRMAFSYWINNAVKTVAAGSQLRYNADATNAGNDLTVSIPSKPELFIRNFTPQDDIKIPNEIVLDYNQPRRFTTQEAAIGAATAKTIIANNRRLDQIPESVYLYVKPSVSAEEMVRTDGMARITNVNIQFGNQVGILSGHSVAQLQALAVENGCDLKNEVEGKYGGFPLRLVFGKDIPLMNNESPGTRGDYNIQVQITCDHQDALDPALDFNELYVNNGQVIISPNECRVQTGLLDMKDNIEAEDMGHHYSEGEGIEGGGLFSNFKSMFKKIPHIVKQGVKHLPQAINTAKQVYGVAQQYKDHPLAQMGLSAMGMGGSDTGGSLTGGSMSGGSITGGKYKSRRH